MNRFLSQLTLITLAVAGVSKADYSFVFPSMAADSAAVNAATPMRTVDEGKGTTTTLSASAGAVKISATWGAVPNWGVAAGIQLPINNLWTPVDFSVVQSVTFEYKTGDVKTGMEFAPISNLYPGYRCGSRVMMLAPYGGSTSFKKVIVALPTGLDWAGWMLDPEKVNQSETALTWDDVKTSIQALQFSPQPIYDSTGSAISGAATSTLEIKNVSIQGNTIMAAYSNWLSERFQGRGCVGKANRLSDFGGSNPARNVQGGSWFAYTDRGATLDAMKGQSTLVGSGLRILPADSASPALAGITANLDKGDANLHPYAGWAGMGTRFKAESGRDTTLNLSGLKAISFGFELDSAFDVNNLTGITLQAINRSVGDSVRFNIGIASDLRNTEVCVDLQSLMQPAWYTSSIGRKPFDPSDLEGFVWEMKINRDMTAKASTSSFFLGNVKLWSDSGFANLGEPAVKDSLTPDLFPPRVVALPPTNNGTCTDGISRRMTGSRSSLVANYTNALVLSYALDGATSARVDVLRMDGRKVASFDASTSAGSQVFPVKLGQGTYLAVVKGAKVNLVAPFVVAR